LDNLTISIRNIYFRFEDKLSSIVTSQPEFTIGIVLKEFSVFTVDHNFEKKDPDSPPHDDPDVALLTFKVALIEGFSVFCDWGTNEVNDLIEKLAAERDEERRLDLFQDILDGEFSSNSKDLVEHKYLIEKFRVELQLQLNKNIKQPSKPATLKFPQIKANIIVGEKELEETKSISNIIVDEQGQMHGDANALGFWLY